METPRRSSNVLPIKSLGPALYNLPDHMILSRSNFGDHVNQFVLQEDYHSMHSLFVLLKTWKQNQITYEVPASQTKFYGRNKIRYDSLMLTILNMLTKNNYRSNQIIKQAIIIILQTYYKKLQDFELYEKYCDLIVRLLESFNFYIFSRVESNKSNQIQVVSGYFKQLCQFMQQYDGFNGEIIQNDETERLCNQLAHYLCNQNLVYYCIELFYTVKIDLQLYLEILCVDQWRQYNCHKVLKRVKNFYEEDPTAYYLPSALRFPQDQLLQLIRMARKYIHRSQIFFAFLTPLLTIFPYIIYIKKSQIKYKDMYTKIIELLSNYLNPNNLDQQNQFYVGYNMRYIKLLNRRNILSELEQSLLVYKLTFDQIEQELSYDEQILREMKKQLIHDYQRLKNLRQKAIKLIEQQYYYDQCSRNRGQKMEPNRNKYKTKFISSLKTFDQIAKRKEKKTNYPKLELQIQEDQQQTAYEDSSLSNGYFQQKYMNNQSENKKPQTYKPNKTQNHKKINQQQQEDSCLWLEKRNGNFNSQYFVVFYNQYTHNQQVKEVYSYKKDFIELLSYRKYAKTQDLLFKQFQTKTYPFISTKLNQTITTPKKINFQFRDKKRMLDRKRQQYIQEIISLWHKVRKIQRKTNEIKKTQSNNKKQLDQLRKKKIQLQKRKQQLLEQFKRDTKQLQTKIFDHSQIIITLFPLIRTKVGQRSTVEMIQNLKDFMKQFRNHKYFDHSHTLRVQEEMNLNTQKNSNKVQNTNKQKMKNKSVNKGSQNSNSNAVQSNKSNKSSRNKTQPKKIHYKYIKPPNPNQFYLSSYLPNPFQQATTGQDMAHDMDYFFQLLYEFMGRFNQLAVQKLGEQQHRQLYEFFTQSFFKKMGKHIQIMLIYYIAQFSKYQSLGFSSFFNNFLDRYMPLPHFISLLRFLILELKLTTPHLNYLYRKLYQIMYNMIMCLLNRITSQRIFIFLKLVNQFTEYGTKNYEQDQSLKSYVERLKRDFYNDFNAFSQLLQFFTILSYSFQKEQQQILPFAQNMKTVPKRQILFFCKNCMFFVTNSYHLNSNNFIDDIHCQHCPYSLLTRFQLQKSEIDHRDTIYDYKLQIKVLLYKSIKKMNQTLKSRQWKIQQLQYVKLKYNYKPQRMSEQTGYSHQKKTYRSQRKKYQALQLQEYFYRQQANSNRMQESNRNKMNKTQNPQFDQLNQLSKIPQSYGRKSKVNSQTQYASHPQFVPEKKLKNQKNQYLIQFEKYCYNAINIHKLFCEYMLKF